MAFDPENPVVQLLGKAAAREGADPDGAAAAYRRAWEIATDDYERCMAAHYVAREQASAEERLRWNAVALDAALLVGDGRVDGFLASLYLNLGRSHEDLGQAAGAVAAYAAAREALRDLPAGPYRSSIEDALARAARRLLQQGSGQ